MRLSRRVAGAPTSISLGVACYYCGVWLSCSGSVSADLPRRIMYRIEVTAQSATLQGARKMALRSGLLDIQTWLKAPSDELDPFKVLIQEIRVADYIQNVEWLLQRAEERRYLLRATRHQAHPASAPGTHRPAKHSQMGQPSRQAVYIVQVRDRMV